MRRPGDVNTVNIGGGVFNGGFRNGGSRLGDVDTVNIGGGNFTNDRNGTVNIGGGIFNGSFRNGGRKKREACKLNPFFFFKT